jgi:hypothetical protein
MSDKTLYMLVGLGMVVVVAALTLATVLIW